MIAGITYCRSENHTVRLFLEARSKFEKDTRVIKSIVMRVVFFSLKPCFAALLQQKDF